MPASATFQPDENPVLSSDVSPGLPGGSTPRLYGLDVLRGIAILGAVFVSVWAAGGFSENQQNGLLTSSKGENYWLYSTVSLLFEGKMRALICIVFGAGMLLYLFKDHQSRELRNADFFIRRQMWLIAFGLINALVFLWSNDLLFHLGIMGVLLFPFIRLSARALLFASIVVVSIYCGKNYWRYSDDQDTYKKYTAVLAVEKKIKADSVANARKSTAGAMQVKDSAQKRDSGDTLTKKQKDEKQAWEGLLAGTKYDAKKDEGENKAMQVTSYTKLWNHQLQKAQTREVQWAYSFGVWDLAAMIFLGMSLFRFGFFAPQSSSKRYVLLAITGLVPGLLLGWFRLHHSHLAVLDYARYIKMQPLPPDFFYPLEMGFLALGYTGLILSLLSAGLLKRVWQVFALAGQMALTNYLLQSIIFLFFFTGFGMGYFARLQQWLLYFFAAEIVLVNVVFSYAWLRYFEYGPAEWLLRSLVYKSWLPNRKNAPPIEIVHPIA